MSPITGGQGVRRVAGLRLPVQRENKLTASALLAAVLGYLTLIPGIPSLARVILLFVFVAVGPGSAILLIRAFSSLSAHFLVPLLGISVVILLTGGLAFAGWWSPRSSLALLAAVTASAALRHLRPLLEELRG